MHKFWASIGEMARESTLIQGVLTAAMVGAYLYLIVVGATVPEDLTQLIWLVVGFWFGSKLQFARRAAAR